MAKFYTNREERSKWLTGRFKEEFSASKSVLDVGCYNADLKKHLKKDTEYTGIDIAGKPTLVINLDEIERIGVELHSLISIEEIFEICLMLDSDILSDETKTIIKNNI